MGTRRMISTGLAALLACLGASGMIPSRLEAQQKPNIIVIMGDDIGWFNIGAYNQGHHGGAHAQPGPAGRRGHALHRLLRRSKLYRRPGQLHHG